MPDAKPAHGFKAEEVSTLASLMSAMQPTSKQEIAHEIAKAKLHETTEPEDDAPVGEALTPMDEALAPASLPKAAPSPAPVVEAAPPARPVSAITLISDKPVKAEGIVKTWISDKITAALTDLGVARDHWDKIEDAVFAAAIAGKLGSGAVGPETEKAISDLVASLAEPAATKGDDELEPITGEPSGHPDEIEPLDVGMDHEPTDMDEVPGEHEPTDMDEPEGEESGDLDDEFASLFGKVGDEEEPEEDDEFGDLEIGDEIEDEEPEEKEPKIAKKEPEKKADKPKEKEKDEKPEKKGKEKDEGMTEAYGVRWSEESIDEGIIVKQAFFKTSDARAHFIRELMESPDFREILDYPEDITKDASNTPSGEQPAGELELPDNIDDRGGDASKHWESMNESKLADVSGRYILEYQIMAFLDQKGGRADEDRIIRAMTFYGFNGNAVDGVIRRLATSGEIERTSGPDGRGYLAIAEKGKTRMQELGESIKSAPLVEVKLEENTEVIYHVKPGLEFSSGTDHTVAPRRYMAPLALPPGLAEAVLYGLLDPREVIVKLADCAIDAKIADELQHMEFSK